MKQIVLEAPGTFSEREAPLPSKADGHALVRMERVGVCGSDFHAFAGRQPIYTYPRIIGHELSGTVVDVSPNSSGVAEGDRCAIEPYISCGKCRACLMGRNNCCENLRLFGIHTDGGMQEFLSVPLNLLHKSDKLSLDQLALIETLGIGAHAVRRSGVKKGQTALIIGAGPIGIAVAQFASTIGAQVHIIEKSEWRRQFVMRIGYSASSTAEGRMADAVFDATGSSAAMAASLTYVATGGSLIYVGLTRDPVCLDDVLFHRKEVTLIASRNSVGIFPQIIGLIEANKIDTSHWITDRLGLSEVPSKFGSLPARETLIKAIVQVNQAT